MKTRRVARALLFAALVLTTHPLTAQTIAGRSLKGDWVRTTSTNNPNDQMRITIDGKGVLTAVPPTVGNFGVGQVLWQSIQSDGSLQVLGSNGQYFPATITMNGPDEIQLAIHNTSTIGTDQTWHRAGPDITGDWVRIDNTGSPYDGTRIDVQGVDGSVRFLPARAPRHLRVGRQLWRSVGASGGLQVLGSDGNYHTGAWKLQAPDRIIVDASAIAGGPGQVWVRPTTVTAARAGLSGPPQNPNTPGSGLTAPPSRSGIPAPATTPPVTPAAPRACLATSSPHDAMGVNWGLAIDKFGTRDRPEEESFGLTPFLTAAVPGPSNGRGGNATIDVEEITLPDGLPATAYLWEARTRRQGSWRVSHGIRASGIAGEISRARAAGERPADVEGYPDPLAFAQTLYKIAWESNPEGIDWKLDHDLSGQEYADEFQANRAANYRLVDVEPHHNELGTLRYAAIWWASCDNANWKQVRNLDRDAYNARVNRENALGFNVIDFESYETSAGQRYAAIMERTQPGRSWTVRSDRTFRGFLNFHREYSDVGMRLIDFEAYDTQGGVRYAGVWAENDTRYDHPFRAAVDTAIVDYQNTHDIPGVSVVAILNDEIIYQRGFGWADIAANKRAWSGTVYATASIAKVVAATLGARLEEQGVLDLSDRTSDFLDYIDENVHTHTVEQLLSKVGCMYHYRELPNTPDPDHSTLYAFRRDAVELMGDNETGLLPGCTPGAGYRYSTHGYTYVGAVFEEVLGGTIYDIIRNEITVPFELWDLEPMPFESFGVGANAGQGTRPYELAQGYHWVGGASSPRDYANLSWKVLGGGLQSSARDLARFGQLTFDGTIVSEGTRDTVLLDAVTTATTMNFDPRFTASPIVGLGWVLATRNGMDVAEHSGDTDWDWGGGSPTLHVYTDPDGDGAVVSGEHLVIAVMNNQRNTQVIRFPAPGKLPGEDDQPVEDLASAIAAAIFADPPP